MGVPADRIRSLGHGEVRTHGHYVLYWMTALRRTRWNFALDHAVDWARRLGKPLVILEALRCDYRWASDRLHAFVLDGMAENARVLASSTVRYHPYVEPRAGAGKGLLRALASHACVVVADDYPAFFLPRALRAASALPVPIDVVDGNGLLPMRTAARVFPTAVSFRRFLQRRLPRHLDELPREDPLLHTALPALVALPDGIERRWPTAQTSWLQRSASAVATLPIDHDVMPVVAGGAAAARSTLDDFVNRKLPSYADGRNHPDYDFTSGLSPFLHFGHLSAHEVFTRIADREQWSPHRLGSEADGKRTGWWGMSPSADAFLDQLVTWRELGFNMCALNGDYESYDSLPGWALATLAKHGKDARERVYTPEELERAQTHDLLWNAAQTQLLKEGRIHNYLRMLWGKKILEWTASPREALAVMIELNNKYALDGRDPSSTSGIFWILGRYDHPWGPERPVFGTVRYMSSRNTPRKVHVEDYLRRYGAVEVRRWRRAAK